MSLAHTPPPIHMPLFAQRWDLSVVGGDYVNWMDLKTDFHYECCSTGWTTPVNNALNDWNNNDTTVLFETFSTHVDTRHVHIYVENTTATDYLGEAKFYYLSGSSWVQCNPDSCDWDKVRVKLYNANHTGFYNSVTQKRGTAAHELGHAIGLKGDDSTVNSCGEGDDDEPNTVMSYQCLDPVEYGGEDIYITQPWDSCGVEHAYYDPNWGYAAC